VTFTDPERRELLTDWNASTRLLAAKFRADSAHHLGDPAFEQLIESLRNASPEFCKAWKRHEVARSGTGRKILNHPVAGELTFEHVVWHPSDSPEQRMILWHGREAGHAAVRQSSAITASIRCCEGNRAMVLYAQVGRDRRVDRRGRRRERDRAERR
jgi:sRNA-binding protein